MLQIRYSELNGDFVTDTNSSTMLQIRYSGLNGDVIVVCAVKPISVL